MPARLSWRALLSFVRQDAQQHGSALRRTLIGEDHMWGLREQLLAAAVDALHVANWQRASGGKRKPKKPRPIPRPGVARHRTAERPQAIPLSQARALFAARNPAAFPQES